MSSGGAVRPAGPSRVVLVAAALAAAVTIGACGGGNGSVVRPGSGTSGTGTSSTSTAPSTTAPSTTAPPAGAQQLQVQPDSGLAATQTVHVTGTGFSANEPLVVAECAAKGAATGPDDCNLAGMLPVTSDATGRVSVDFTVVKGPFGVNKIVCDASQQCLVSVNQATPAPTQQASRAITFR
jgi:hypothetical protein